MVSTVPKKTTKVVAKEPPVIKGKINIEVINKTNALPPRIKAMRDRYLKAISKVSSDRPWYMMQSYKQTEGQHPAIRRAKALANFWDNKAIAVLDLDLIMGNFTDAVRGAHPPLEYYPEQMRILLEKNEANWTNSQQCQADLSKEDYDKLLEVAKYFENDFHTPEQKKRCEDLVAEIDPDDWERELSWTGINWAPEFFPKGKRFKKTPLTPRPQAAGQDHEKALKVGYKGLIKSAKDHMGRIKEGATGRELLDEEKGKLAVLESMVIVLEAMIRYARRYAALAEKKAAKEQDPQRKAELLKAAEACRWVPENPPRTFYEAMQMFWFTTLGIYADKAQPNVFAGRFDQYMYPYYIADINEGRATRQEVAELIGCLIMKLCALEPYMTPEHRTLSQGTNYENITIGGCDVHGRDASNELSCILLHVAKDTKTHQPYISLRYDRKMAPELLDKALECNRKHGAGIPAFFSDRVNIEYMLSRGHTLEHARDHAIAGCINCVYPKAFAWIRLPTLTSNVAKMLEVVLHRGVDPRTGVKIGNDYGDPRKFKTFDKFVDTWKKEFAYFINGSLDKREAWDRAVNYSDDLAWYWPFMSAHMEGCIESGVDVGRNGAVTSIDDAHYALDRFFQDTSDSLIAIKKLVFEQKKYTMDQILTAIDANWEGYDQIRADCLAQPKYGNDDDEADELMSELWSYATNVSMARKDIFGRHYIIYRQGSSVAAAAGKVTGALPNGRKAGEWLADASLSPVQGMDRKGPTAVVNSVTKIDFSHMDGTLLNMKLCPSLLDKPAGMMKFKQLVQTYFDKGGQEIQFNILDKDMLMDAQKNPKNYRDLVVRVAGYSAFWVDLEKQVQDEIIRRTEHEM
jgi:pyruvate formate-lyase/glycerol dehydratase family glycyl radical enzyme